MEMYEFKVKFESESSSVRLVVDLTNNILRCAMVELGAKNIVPTLELLNDEEVLS